MDSTRLAAPGTAAAQLAAFIAEGFLVLPVASVPPEFHDEVSSSAGIGALCKTTVQRVQ